MGVVEAPLRFTHPAELGRDPAQGADAQKVWSAWCSSHHLMAAVRACRGLGETRREALRQGCDPLGDRDAMRGPFVLVAVVEED